jgi:hypothetical protein
MACTKRDNARECEKNYFFYIDPIDNIIGIVYNNYAARI